MDSQSLLTRIVAAGLPLVLIALAFGAAGYILKEPDTTPIPPLATAEPSIPGARGELTNIAGDRLTIVLEDGTTRSFPLAPGATIEALEPIALADVRVGDWLNGGAIAHPQTVLALVGLILLTEPQTP